MCCVESTSTPIASVKMFLALSIILNSLSVSSLKYFCLAFYSRRWLTSLISSTIALSKSDLEISISLCKSISFSTIFPLTRSFSFGFGSTFDIYASYLETKTMVEIVGLVEKTCIVPTDGLLIGVVEE